MYFIKAGSIEPGIWGSTQGRAEGVELKGSEESPFVEKLICMDICMPHPFSEKEPAPSPFWM